MGDYTHECCNEKPALTRRDLLCAGGAGFVTALTAALMGNSQVARAETLGAKAPEVDWLAVSIVTDNRIDQFIPAVKRDGFAAERNGSNLTLSPDAPPHATFTGEWGLAMHAASRRDAETRNVLIDFGYTAETLLNNLALLKADPGKLDALVLSHGHYDHFGGLVGFLNANKGKHP